jgi:NAD(P)-dependent dehydrogenase (short-subunit alcohol dehydrogenase family)
MDRTGRVTLTTGGRRIGAAVAEALARAGSDVSLTFRHSREEAERSVAAVRSAGRRAIALEADLRDPMACARVVDTTADRFGRLDVLVNMASVDQAKSFDELTVEDWDRQLEVDLRAAWLCTRAAVPHMRRQGGGRVVNVADWTAPSGRPRYREYLPYYVAKAGVVALTEGLALELAADQILVNAIAPGAIAAPDDMTDTARLAVERATPLGRWGGESEMTRLALFLASTDFVTGETIRIDGGRHLR